MTLLIVNADDLGLTDGVSRGILEAHARGIVTSASLMVTMPAAEAAVRAAEAHPRLSLGLHFTQDDPEVLDDDDQLAAAFAAQLAAFRALVGRDPTHVDSHHHVHLPRLQAFRELSSELGVPLRGAGEIKYVGDFYGLPEPGRTDLELIGPEHLLSLLSAHAHEAVIELGCHPGHVTPALHSTYRPEREHEILTLTRPGLRRELLQRGFQLISFAELSSSS